MLQSVKNALGALDYILERYREGEGASLRDVAVHLGLQKTTTRNMLKTMEECGYLSRGSGRSYLLGPKCTDIERTCKYGQKLIDIAGKYLIPAAENIEESLVMTTIIAGRRKVLIRAGGGNVISVDPSIAENNNTYNMVTNRIMLAYAKPSELEVFIKENGMPSGEWNGVETYEELVIELLKMRKKGYGEDRNENLSSMAFPIFNENGSIVAALGSYVPLYRYDQTKAAAVKKSLKETAGKITTDFCSQ